jgi:protein-S-isoprenylcysteine O-methyltransferase Ste14
MVKYRVPRMRVADVSMAVERPRRAMRSIPLTLALAMLAIVVLAGLLPNTGVVSASSNCSYGKCPASSPFPLWAVSTAAVIAVLAVIVALLLLRRRGGRRPPQDGDAGAAGTTGQDPSDPTSSEGQQSSSPSWEEPTTPEGEASPPMADDGTGLS